MDIATRIINKMLKTSSPRKLYFY